MRIALTLPPLPTRNYQPKKYGTKQKDAQPYHLGAYGLFCDGASLRYCEHGGGPDVQGPRCGRKDHYFLDRADFAAMESEIHLEPYHGIVSHKEILCGVHTIAHRY